MEFSHHSGLIRYNGTRGQFELDIGVEKREENVEMCSNDA